MWSPISARIVTSMPSLANPSLTTADSSWVSNMTAIEAMPSPRASRNSRHRLGPSVGSSSSKFKSPTMTSAPRRLYGTGLPRSCVPWCIGSTWSKTRQPVHPNAS